MHQFSREKVWEEVACTGQHCVEMLEWMEWLALLLLTRMMMLGIGEGRVVVVVEIWHWLEQMLHYQLQLQRWCLWRGWRASSAAWSWPGVVVEAAAVLSSSASPASVPASHLPRGQRGGSEQPRWRRNCSLLWTWRSPPLGCWLQPGSASEYVSLSTLGCPPSLAWRHFLLLFADNQSWSPSTHPDTRWFLLFSCAPAEAWWSSCTALSWIWEDQWSLEWSESCWLWCWCWDTGHCSTAWTLWTLDTRHSSWPVFTATENIF